MIIQTTREIRKTKYIGESYKWIYNQSLYDEIVNIIKDIVTLSFTNC